MKNYLITWTIDIDDVSNPIEAAKEAFKAMQRPGTEAVVFDVKDKKTGKTVMVDLNEIVD